MQHFLSSQLALFRKIGPFGALRFNYYLWQLGLKAHKEARLGYRILSPTELASLKRSKRVYIFGSGYSLNDLLPEEWVEIEKHDTIGFNAFVRQKWVRVDFHLVRGWGEGSNVGYNWQREVAELAELINDNPCYRDTAFLLQDEHFAQVSRVLLAEKLLKKESRVAFYHTANKAKAPSYSLSDGLQHMSGTLTDAVNLAFCLGWREIVLVGVDLYDTRYFWLKKNETFCTNFKTGERTVSKISDRGQRYDQPHSTTKNGVIKKLGVWKVFMEKHKVKLSVYNPSSLLAQTLPVFNRKTSPGRNKNE